ncbi:ATP-binding protein [Dyella tabacisoli]|uniref:Sensory/regulatory protein RpfC n=1 Tax=Dyella tabacisoli TaxID=2282381 RepID=A0A369URN9_9GAMM|nr:ATP-binding protein [Dyella tabacisoli]RDD83326.1 response regulator [Dyella tabacisoli]
MAINVMIGTLLARIDLGALPTSLAVITLAALLTVTASLALLVLWLAYRERSKATRASLHLLAQEATLRAWLDALPMPIIIKDQDGAYLRVNHACQRELGIGAATAIGKTSLELPDHRLSGPDGAPLTHQQLHEFSLEAVRADREYRTELAYLDDEGQPKFGLWIDRPVHRADGSVSGSISSLLDITTYREIAQHARASEQNLREVTQHIPVVIFIVNRGLDRLRRLTFLAGDLRALFGLDQRDLVETDNVLHDWPFQDRIHPEDRDQLKQVIRGARQRPQAQSLDFRAYGEEGLRWIHLAMAPQALADGSVQWTGYFIDTTRINTHNDALRAARDAAERASKAKADFLATMSHEIRTPMNGVIGMLELLSHTELNDEQHELLHAVEDSAGVLLQVLNDVLDFSKIEAGDLRLDNEPFNARTLIDNVVSMMAAHMHKKGLRIQVAVDAALADRLNGDSVRIRQILLNLLNNAGKFTEHGGVTVKLRVLGDNGTHQRLRLSVTDTGIGIAEDKQARLFTPFVQAESWTTRRHGGTGLGLAICRHLVQLMGGSIELTSQLGVGTTVTVELRLPVDRREVDAPPGLAGRHVIVRLSSTETAMALTAYLTALGLTTEQIPPSQTLRTGISANILFLDEDDDVSQSQVAAQAVLVSERAGTPTSTESAGGNGRLILNANPLKWQAVMRTCMLALEPLHQPVRQVMPNYPDADVLEGDHLRHLPTHGRILIAEDHHISQQLIRRQLMLLGWSCDVVGTGKAAYEALQKDDYAMLITDCQMPVMNGYELAIAWRQYEDEDGKQTRMPILAMTANALSGEMERCREAGMDDYISKPVQLRVLEEKLALWMPRPSAGDALPDLADTAATDFWSPESDLLGLRDDMLPVLIESTQTDLDHLQQAVSADDTHEAIQRLHRILGALQLFSDDPMLNEGRQWLGRLHGEQGKAYLQQLPPYIEALHRLLDTLKP